MTRFRAALDLLPDYPCTQTEEPVVVDVEDAPPINYNIVVPTTPVFPGDLVTWQSSVDRRQLFARTLASIQWNGNNSMVMLGVARDSPEEPFRPLTPDARGIVQVSTRPGDKWTFAEDRGDGMSRH